MNLEPGTLNLEPAESPRAREQGGLSPQSSVLSPQSLRVLPLPARGEVTVGADLAGLVADAAEEHDEKLLNEDVLVVTQKVVSKAEGRLVRLEEVEPSPFAVQLAAQHGRDPRHVEVVLRESRRIVKMDRGIIISETHHWFVCANAGVDASNVGGGTILSLLPVDPDRSASTLRERLRELAGVAPAVIISDTFGRVWRTGLTNVAIGVAGMAPLKSYAGMHDPYGYELRVTVMAVADELAAAAELVMGKTDRVPFVLIRGFPYDAADGSAAELVREASLDLFR